MSKPRKKGEGAAPGIPMEQPTRLAVQTTREQHLRAVNTVCAFVPAGLERDFVLEALFRPPYRTPPTNVSRTHESVVRFDAAYREQQAGRAA